MGHCTLGPPSLQGLPQGIAGIRATTGIASELYALGGCGMCLRVSPGVLVCDASTPRSALHTRAPPAGAWRSWACVP
jgi:hypothetical protein